MTYSDETIQALAFLRETVATGEGTPEIRKAFNILDDAGVFAALDEQTDYAPAEEILAESAAMHLDGRLVTLDPALYPQGTVMALDPAEWGDTTRIDLARHQGTLAVGHPLTQTAARALFGDTEPSADEYGQAARMIDSLRPKGRPVQED
jgi:hypothetical protein